MKPAGGCIETEDPVAFEMGENVRTTDAEGRFSYDRESMLVKGEFECWYNDKQ